MSKKTFRANTKAGVVTVLAPKPVFSMKANGGKMFRIVGKTKDGVAVSSIVSEATAKKYGVPRKAPAKKAPAKKAPGKLYMVIPKGPLFSAPLMFVKKSDKKKCDSEYAKCMSGTKVKKAVVNLQRSTKATAKAVDKLEKITRSAGVAKKAPTKKAAGAKRPVGRPPGSGVKKAAGAKRPVGRPPGSGAKKSTKKAAKK